MKKSLLIALALMLVLAFATSAMAAQVLNPGTPSPLIKGVNYAPTGSTYDNIYLPGVYPSLRFNADGTTNYPYEIYLPNEQAPDQYRIHSNYAKNTDACASCHATHTAVGNSLLQWYTTYETCMACHDGTLGSATYNVLDGKIGATSAATFGGMFGLGNGSESVHNVAGAVQNAAAPGGSASSEAVTVGADNKTRWNVAFGCESCHSPHGMGGNARILHPDPNFAASAAKVATGYAVNADGTVGTGLYILKGYPYTISIQKTDGTTLAGAYITNVTGVSQVVYEGVVATTGIAAKVYGTPSLKVKMDIDNYLKPIEEVQHISGMNAYCGACHTDYNTATFGTTGSGKADTGTYSKAHRHQVGNNWSDSPRYVESQGLVFEGTITDKEMECLTCHVAHGTSQDWWAAKLAGKAGTDGTLWPDSAIDSQYEELAGSSALKRMPNMGTCEACHVKGQGAEGYNVNAGIDPAPSGLANVTNPGLEVVPTQWYIGGPIAAANASTWVGSDKCQPCHAAQVTGWKSNKHQTASSKRIDGAGSCGAFDMSTGGIMNCHLLGTTAKGLLVGDAATVTAANTAAKAAGNPFYYLSSTDHGIDSAVTCEACHFSAAAHVAAPSAKNIYNPGRKITGETVAQAFERENKACGICHNDREVVDASTTVAQINNGTIHDGPSAYADSKHFTEGLIGCPDCHDAHGNGATNPAITKLPYDQLCVSCHGTATIGTVAQTMDGGADHSFTFGTAGATKLPDSAVATILPNATGASLTVAQAKAGSRRAAPGLKVTSADALTTYYSFLGGTYTLTTTSGAILTTDYTWDATRPRLTFTATADATRIQGEYRVTYTNTLNPLIQVTVPTTFLTVTN